ncbi:MAG: hypothetical protein ACJ8FY_00665 [Gemmataceae bacterium]
MTKALTYQCDIHFRRRGRGSRRELESGLEPPRPAKQPGRVPRVSRLMALAIRFEQMFRDGVVDSYAELATLGHVSRARVSQIMNLLNLATDLQEAILFLPRTECGRDPIHLRHLQPIATVPGWRKQRRLLQELLGRIPKTSNGTKRFSSCCKRIVKAISH